MSYRAAETLNVCTQIRAFAWCETTPYLHE